MTGEDLVGRWQNERSAFQIEGEKGIDNLNKLAKVLGYNEDGFKYGSPLENFLKDNPGAVEKILEFIANEADYPCNPFRVALLGEVGDTYQDESDED